MGQPERIGRYVVDEVLSVDPLGTVARARIPELNRDVYLRTLSSPPELDPEVRERLFTAFDQQCRALARVTDARIPRPYDFGTTDRGARYLAYDCPEGAGCSWLPTEPSALPAELWLGLAAELAQAVSALMEGGVAVRAFEPEWAFVTGNNSVCYLPVGPGCLPPVEGLPAERAPVPAALAAPEVLAGSEPSPASLTFSAAAWLYAMLSGDPAAALGPRVAAGPRLRPLPEIDAAVSTAVDDALARALLREPEGRFATPRELAVALVELPVRAAVVPSPTSPAPADSEPSEAEELAVFLRRCAAWGAGLGLAGCLTGWVWARTVLTQREQAPTVLPPAVSARP